MTQLQRLVGLATQQVYAMSAFIGEMRPPLSSPGRPQCALFLSLAEQHEATTLLTQAGLSTHAAINLRSMLEALADLHLLGLESDHVARMRYKLVKGEKSLYTPMLEAEDLPEGDRVMLQQRLAQCMEHYTPLHDKFGKKEKRSQAQDFIAAGLRDLIAPYGLLCSFAHNDLAALAFRHQGQQGMTHRAPALYDLAFMILSLASYVLLNAADAIKEVVYLPEGRFAHHYAILERLQAEIMLLRPLPHRESDQ
ncbi:DUF5677 domain-containing protein [Xanthomonas hortorum]|uniref:DUF5677 domain-containing protein n=1 Tax=Xanthomonas hortorum TaxID=56454 RepID=UPI00331613ED